MKRVAILFVLLHLLVDLAIPSWPGAFRFNPDESVVAVRVETVQAHDLASAIQGSSLQMTVELPRLDLKPSVGLRRSLNVPDLFAFLPRRDPSPDQSRKGSTEDH